MVISNAVAHEPAGQTWCDSKADSTVWMREDKDKILHPGISGIFYFVGGIGVYTQKTRYLTKIGLLSAFAALLMFLELPLPMMPVFLKLDISELPAVIAAFSMGPVAAILVDLLKNVIHAFNTQTMMIGEMANLLVGIAFLVPTGYIYKKRSDMLGAAVALLCGTLSMMLAASFLNYYVLLPLYQAVLHFPLEKIILLGTAANPHIVDLKTFITLAIVPFNAIKGIVIALFTLVLYKKVLPLLREN